MTVPIQPGSTPVACPGHHATDDQIVGLFKIIPGRKIKNSGQTLTWAMSATRTNCWTFAPHCARALGGTDVSVLFRYFDRRG
jgi:hypothetical protein